MDDILTIEQLLQAYQSGEVSARTLLSEKWQQAKQDEHHSWISLISEPQLENYLSRLEQFSVEDLPLYGVPFAIKDNIDLEGLNTTAGCREYSYAPDESAFVVALLIEAGAVPLGKTNLDQFATGLVGTRSPWGETRNSFNPEYVSGGSSAGSAVSVATNQAFFSLGTDTAGSGRVPAAFNNLFGLKPTKGLLSCSGVVPACKSLDCVTLFTRAASDLAILHKVVAVYDNQDCYARPYLPSSSQVPSAFSGLKVGVPSASQLEFFGNTEYQAGFESAVAKLAALGAELVEFDLEPFLQAAKLLYQGPWVAERYAAIQAFFDQDSSRCLPVIETIIGGAKSISAADTFNAMYQLQAYKVICDERLASVDVVITPTAGSTYTIADVNADPITLNSNLGYYTNFMNLLDYAALAMPSSFCPSGLPFGFTLFAPAHSDSALIALADVWQQQSGLPLGATGKYLPQQHVMDVLVCGAHMQGLALNHQLLELGGVLKSHTQTSANYRFYALGGEGVARPGLVRDESSAAAIDVEVWLLPVANVGKLLAKIPYPLGLGKVELESGEWVSGFICEPSGLNGAEDITEFGSWRKYINV